MTAGEKRFARMLESHLEDDYLCWYDLPVGIRQRYTDFIVLHPRRGLLLLEVKDWKLDSILRFDKESFYLQFRGKQQRKQNPIAQVRDCSHQLVNFLKADPALVQQDGKYQGNLVFPYARGVVFTNITRAEIEHSQIDLVIPPELIICKDEMQKSMDEEHFQKQMWDMFKHPFPPLLTLPQIDRIRWHLFPEIRLKEPTQTELLDEEHGNTDDTVESLFPDVVRVMDTRQERLARSLGDGHRVVHGVSGSGKTLILGYRSRYLASQSEKPVLLLCFNVALAASLREMTADIEGEVHVKHFHDWCGEQLKTYHVQKPSSGKGYFTKLVDAVINGVASGQIPSAQYSAVLIDEGHDFDPAWLKLIVGMIDPVTDSLLLVYDDAQSLYGKQHQLGFSLSSVGINARGRTTILRLNYRNTKEVLSFACQFVSEWWNAEADDSTIVEPQSAGAHGPQPVLRKFENYEDEVEHIVKVVDSIQDDEISDVCIAYRSKWMGEKLNTALVENNISVHWLKNAKEKKLLNNSDSRVKLMTMHSSKGLEFPFMILSGTGAMPVRGCDTETEARLLYVAMTRSTDKLLVTAHKNSLFYDRMSQIAA